jgi:hypothetical protein
VQSTLRQRLRGFRARPWLTKPLKTTSRKSGILPDETSFGDEIDPELRPRTKIYLISPSM